MKVLKRGFIFSFLIYSLACVVSCGSQNSGFQQTDEGLSYKFYEIHPEAATPAVSDYLKLRMDYFLHDSLIYSSADHEEYPRIQFQTPRFKGDIITGLGMMHLGDSASFLVRADSTLRSMFDKDPAEFGVTPNDQMRFEIRMLQIQSEKEFQQELDSMVSIRRQQEEAMNALKIHAQEEFNNYLKINNIKETAAYNRVFIIPMKLGDGPKASPGMIAHIKYEAYLLDGTYIGSSDSLGLQYYEVPIGQGKVLEGLDEGLVRMSKGEKAKIVVPYALAYGENGTETIPPCTNLLFVVEMLDLVADENK